MRRKKVLLVDDSATVLLLHQGMLLELGYEAVTAEPRLHTRDLGGTATTAQVTDAVCQRLATM